jgi:hypothetical protein
MAKTHIKAENLAKAISEHLGNYHTDVLAKIDAAGKKCMEDLVTRTKKTAPKRTGAYRRAITYTETERPFGNTYTWHAKGKHNRRTHLLVHGHEKKGGGRVPGNPFLHNALDQVLPVYEEAVEEALKQ